MLIEFYRMVQQLTKENIEKLKKTIPVLIGERVKMLRNEKKLSQSELSKLVFKDRQYLYKIEKGIVTPNVFTLSTLAIAMGVNLNEIFDIDIELE